MSCWTPSVAETVWVAAALNVTGSAPYLIWSASTLAEVGVNWPVICDWPVRTPWISGAEMTSLSRTTATRQCVALWESACAAARHVSPDAGVNASRVRAAHLFWPALVKSSETTHWPCCWSSCGLAVWMSVPTTLATSRNILAPLPSHVVTCALGASIEPFGRLFSWSQLIVGTLNCICGVSALTSSPVSVANFAYVLPAVGSVLRFGGSVSLLAAAQAAAPTFFSTAARCAARSGVTGAAEADGFGAGVAAPAGADALALGAGSPPPWPPLDAVCAAWPTFLS